MTILACISGHGFGHWTRSAALLERLAAREPVHVRSCEPAFTLVRRAPWPASVAAWDVGPGCAQRGPLEVDVGATARAVLAHAAAWPALLDAYLGEARALAPRLVLGDAPPLAFALAARLGVPGVAVANFTWSWIYAPFVAAAPELALAVELLRAAEGRATHVIELPGGGGLRRLGAPGRPTLGAALRRRPTCERAEARRRLAALAPPGDRPRALLTFGGYGDALDLSAAAAACPDVAFVTFAPPAGPLPENVAALPHDHGLPHQDLVLGADAVLGKPGYGTVAECLTGPTPMVYVQPTGTFREHPRLVDAIERWLPCAPISPEALRRGAWRDPLERALRARARESAPPDGLDEAVAFVARAQA